jgi:hypothetical protein
VREGRCYVLQAAGKSYDSVITVTHIEEGVVLGSMTLRQAKRAGYKTLLEARKAWLEQHGSYDPEQRVFLVSFVLGDQTDQPRLLAASPGAPHGDYVTLGQPHLAGAGEAIPEALQARYAGEARAACSAAQDGALEARTRRLLELVREISGEAREPRVRESLRVAERGLQAAQRKIGA